MRPERKKEIEHIREEGAQASRSGRSSQSCPREYRGTTNEYQWLCGYQSQVSERQAQQKADEDQRTDFLDYLFENQDVLRRLIERGAKG